MTRALLLLSLMCCVRGTAWAEETQRVPLGTRTTGVFQLSPQAPSRSFTVPVRRATKLMIDVATPEVAVDVTVTDPLGQSRDPSIFERFAVSPEEVPALGAALYEAGVHVQTQLDAPLAGNWTVTVTLPAGSSSALGNMIALTAGGFGTAAFTSRPFYTVGEPVVLAMAAFDGSSPVTGATVQGLIYQNGSSAPPLTVTLHDDGTGPDAAAGDGLFSTELSNLALGHYLVELTLRDGAFQSIAATDFEVMASLARLTGALSDQGVDTNGDGLFDIIRVNLGVHVDVAGTYELLADLRLDKGDRVTAGTHVTLAAGDHTVNVPFTAEDIRTYLSVDGPWRVRNVRLVAAEPGRMVDRRDSPGATTAYMLTQLQRPKTLILYGLTRSVADTNGNGLYDTLTATLRVDTLVTGSYTWTSDLRAPNGTVLGVASGSGHLAAGTRSIPFVFQGRPIGTSGLNGPYELRNVAVYGPQGAVALKEEAGLIRNLTAAQFEGSQSSFERLLDETQRLVITGIGGVPRGEEIRTSLLRKAESARAGAARGERQSAKSVLASFQRELKAESGQHLDMADVERLSALVEQLQRQLGSDRR